MIGWRPVLLTFLAASIIAVAVLHSVHSTPPCGAADSLRDRGLLSEARVKYVKLLRTESVECVTDGLDSVTAAQCERAAELVAASPGAATNAYTAIAKAEPVRAAAVCARTALARLAP